MNALSPLLRSSFRRSGTAVLVLLATVLVVSPLAGTVSPPTPATGAAAPAAGPRAAAPLVTVPTAPAAAPPGWTTQDTLFVTNGTLRAGNLNTTNWGRPWYVAYDPTTGDLYASVDCSMYVIDPSTFQVIAPLTASGGCGVIYLASTGFLYESAAGNISVVDPVTDTIVQRILAPEAGKTVYGLFVYDAAANAIVVGNAFDSVYNVVSLTQGRIVANLTLGYDALDGAYDPVNQNLYVAEYESGAVAIINATWAVTTVSVSSEGLFAYGVTVDPRTGDAYVSTYDYSTGMVRISGTTNKILNESSFGSYLTGLAFNNASDVVYAADSSQQKVYVVNATTLAVESSFSVVAPAFGIEGPWWMTWVPQLDMLYLPTSYQKSIVAVNGANDTESASVGGVTEPDATAWDPACSCLVVGDYFTENLWFINATTFTVMSTVHLPGEVRGITYDNATDRLWVGLGGLIGSSGVDVLYAANGTSVQLLSSGTWSNAAAYDPTDDRMYVPAVLGNKLNVYNATNLTLVQSIPDSYANGVAWDPTNDEVYAADWEATNVTVYDGGNGTLVATIEHIPGPAGVVYDPSTGRLYTANQNDQNLSVIDPVTNTATGNLTLVGQWAEGLLPAPGTDELVISTESDSVTFFNLTTNTTTAVSAGQATIGLAWIGSDELAATDLTGAVYLIANASLDLMTTPTFSVLPSVLAVGSNFTATTVATGGVAPYSYAYSGLPAGCASTNASAINCAPTVGGTYRITGRATDAANRSLAASATVWVEPTYPVTFHALGLSTGVTWWVNVSGGRSLSSTSSTITLTSINATLRFSVGVGGPWVATHNATGSFTIDGTPVSISIDFAETQPVVFTDAGVPSGTEWQVAIGPTLRQSTGLSISIDELPGSYRYVASVVGGGYGAVSGIVTVSNASVPVGITFVAVTYQLAFLAKGPPTGTGWSVALSNGDENASTGAEIVFQLPNGTYRYDAQAASTQWRAVTGNASIQGSGSAVSLPFQPQTYSVTFTAPTLPSGTPFWVNLSAGSGWYGTGGLGGPEPNGTYAFTASAGVGWSTVSATFNVSGAPTNVSLAFAELDRTVTFTAVGLAPSASWSVNFTGVAPTATTAAQVSLTLQRGVGLAYEARGPTDQAPLRPRGTVPASTADQTVSIPFPPAVVLTSFTATPESFPLGGSTQVTAVGSGGEPPLNYSFSAPNDAGCGGSSAGSLTCVPSTQGSYTVLVTVSDGDGSYVNGTLTLTVTSPSPSSAPDGSTATSLGIAAAVAALVVAVMVGLLMGRRRRSPPATAQEPTGTVDPQDDPLADAPNEGAGPDAPPVG